jgi:nitrate reductase gamma subunit
MAAYALPIGGVRLSPLAMLGGGCAILLLVLGLLGYGNEGVGYGILLLAGLLLFAGLTSFSLFVFTNWLNGGDLLRSAKWLLIVGGLGYLIGLSELSGYYVHEAFVGRIAGKWIIFGPVVVAALFVLDLGLYQGFIRKQVPTWRRFGHVVSRNLIDHDAMRRTLLDDVILHRTLYSVSRFRWLRHTLIFWGFMLMFGVELIAVIFREALPAFGFRDVYADPASPIRGAFKFAFDLTGLAILIGCVMALAWRVHVRGTALKKYSDTPTTLFLFFVVSTGFVVEAFQIAAAGRPTMMATGFVGYSLSFVTPTVGPTVTDSLWLIHVMAACAFIGYVPVWRLVHSCATPLGRLANSQKLMLSAKKMTVLSGLMRRTKA